MPATPPALDNRPMADLALLERIRALADMPANGASPGALAEIEHTLTDGYARALALEAERWRIERRLAEVAATLARRADAKTTELSSLARRLADTDEELTRLRTMLASLRERRDEARAA